MASCSAASRAKVGWERGLEVGVDGEEDDLEEYYFRKTGVRIFYSGRMLVSFGNSVDSHVDMSEEGMMAIRLPCSHVITKSKIKGRGAFRLSEMEYFARQRCRMPIVKVYPCGHKLVLTCPQFRSLGGEQRLKICPYRCERVADRRCFHPCRKACGENCDPCMLIRLEAFPTCSRKHLNEMFCFVAKDDVDAKMELRCVEEIFPNVGLANCGHAVRVKCFEADTITVEELDKRCNLPCQAVLKDCGHKCSGSCVECYGFRLHKKCVEKCQKILICDHKCPKTCGEVCGPCGRSCWRKCAHKQCQLECGVPCQWECDEPCDYGCEHGQRCTMKCGEPCNKAPCQEPCPLKIPTCGHDCVGFCGEKCPPWCRHCTPEKLKDGVLLTLGEVDEHDRFIYLEGCGHCVESSAMDQWMNSKDGDSQILLKRCPICRSRLNWMCRYSEVMKGNWEAIESVKKRIFGDIKKIEEVLGRIEKKVSDVQTTTTFYPRFLNFIWNKIDRDASIGCRRVDMSWTAVRWMEWILDEWFYASSQAVQCAGVEGIDADVDNVDIRWQGLFWVVGKREWPLENTEMIAFFREKQRLEDYTKVCQVLKEARGRDQEFFWKTFRSASGKQNFAWVMQTLKQSKSYDPFLQEQFDKAFKKFSGQMKVTLAISEQEKLGILEAFGGQDTGRWFKCPNGHVYVITECSGAVIMGRCPECRARIGGLQHRLIDSNHLATEMDGADEPAYDRLVRQNEQAIRDARRMDQQAVQEAIRRNQEEAQRLALRWAQEDGRRRFRFVFGGRPLEDHEYLY